MPRIKPLKIYLLVITLTLFSHYSLAAFTQLNDFGANPGDLTASYYSPKYAPKNKKSAMVVLLHGCAQQGEELAQQSGLLALAKKHQFALLLPQQGLSNNIKRCFNWYSDDDYAKGRGESLSIKNMITTLKQQLDSSKIYIIGLSGGGAMASSLLVNYPDLFAAGAVVAGIPFPCANDLITGISCMRNGPSQTAEELALLAKERHPEQKKWPKLSVWSGGADGIVNPLNSQVLAKQWAILWKIATKPIVINKTGYTITHWQDEQKNTQIELVEVAERGHGIMVNPKVENGGTVSDYLLASPVSTAKQVIDFWQL